MNVKGICWFFSFTIGMNHVYVAICNNLNEAPLEAFFPSNKTFKINGHWVDAITYKLLESPIAWLPWESLLLNP